MTTVPSHPYEGVLPIWKPKGWTSHDVVAKARRLLRMKRIGHTGTLDPEVTGVLPLCLGRSTRLVEYIQEQPKQYEALLKLGIATDTQDISGTVIEQCADVRGRVTESELRAVIHRFEGQIEQVPPMYSAVKVNGQRLYDLARQGKEVERKARSVTIHSIELLDQHWELAHPEIRFRVRCSKGTYIRTLCVDIGTALGVPSVMAELIRTETAGISGAQCLTLEQVEELAGSGQLQASLLPMEKVLRHMPSIRVNESQRVKLLQGQQAELLEAPAIISEQAEAAAWNDNGQLIGIVRLDLPARRIVPHKMFT